MLTRQSEPADEVLVVDDGLSAGETVIQNFKTRLPLSYDWRPNDQSPALSRNRGAARAQRELLVFLDGDLLLQPQALAAYRAYLTGVHTALLYGYAGTHLESQAPSHWFPERQVNWLDKRYAWDGTHLKPHPHLFHSAYEYAFAGNFALYAETYRAIGGFDERFRGWGGEDLDFAERAVQKGFEVHFLIDAWGEHQVHPRQEEFHLRPAEVRAHAYAFRPHPPMPYRVRCLGSEAGRARLEHRLRQACSDA